MNEEYLFDKSLLEKLDFQPAKNVFNPFISAGNPGKGLCVRPLSTGDYDKGFMELLGQLTDSGHPTKEEFLEKFKAMKECVNTYFVTVIEDLNTNKIIGAATLVVEHKFIHRCSKRGHLEDVVVNNTYRGKQLGKLIVVTVTLLAKQLGCYKMSLECKDKLIPFYVSLGYKLEPGNSNSMVQRFNVAPS
ncbi:conserved hypothetical protein [Pediculus humanus corporis]|uniref:Glucosamine 6-phosphate N-acetyltransferase n=1 Tax=Pediculus humanus subsp. corporis TaxID=121224 RepID=E0VYG6_PEDHC|nr:uncharacterized protein Phum_PHUM514050 [Pediculus humanus corporis]EEB18422.1 conserved hypothetical protein [Pediculus humanus corporis]